MIEIFESFRWVSYPIKDGSDQIKTSFCVGFTSTRPLWVSLGYPSGYATGHTVVLFRYSFPFWWIGYSRWTILSVGETDVSSRCVVVFSRHLMSYSKLSHVFGSMGVTDKRQSVGRLGGLEMSLCANYPNNDQFGSGNLMNSSADNVKNTPNNCDPMEQDSTDHASRD